MQKTLGNQPLSVDNKRDGIGEETPTSPLTTEREEGAEMADSDSTPGKAPAFQFYPNDFLADANVVVMSMQERGVYITLICYCWQQGTLPSSPERLAALCGLSIHTFRKLWPAVSVCFRAPTQGDRISHPRLDRERKKHRAYRKLQSDKGKLGGRPKKPELVSGIAVAFSDVPRQESSSSFNLQASNSDLRTAVVGPAAPDARSKRPVYTSDRFAVFEWQFSELSKMLGPHVDAFRLDEFFDALTQQSRADGLVIPKADAWAWLQAEVLAEAKRRGLPMASTAAPARDKKAIEEAQNAEVLRLIQQDRENRSRYAGR